jgi:hypothetical protein
MIPDWYAARSPICLLSAPGIGKTSIIEDAIPELSKMFNQNLGMVPLNGGDMNVADTVGYLMPRDRGGVFTSEFSLPYWWFTREGKPLTDYDGGFIFFDEIDKAPLDVKKIAGALMWNGRCGPHYLPPGWQVWAAANRLEDRSGSTKELDHLINRRYQINVTPHLQSWKDWAFSHNVHPTFIAYAEKHSDMIFNSEVPEKQQPWPTPRSFVKVANDLVAFAKRRGVNKIPDDELVQEFAAGIVGHGLVASLFSYITLGNELPSFDDIIANPSKTRVPSRADAQMIVVYELAARVEEEMMNPVVEYIERFPKEFSVSFAKAACRRDPDLLNTPAITRWCATNHSLMTAISDRS